VIGRGPDPSTSIADGTDAWILMTVVSFGCRVLQLTQSASDKASERPCCDGAWTWHGNGVCAVGLTASDAGRGLY